MRRHRRLDQSFVFRCSWQMRERLRNEAALLRLPESELARRALVVYLGDPDKSELSLGFYAS
jgi:hypothetical protein